MTAKADVVLQKIIDNFSTLRGPGAYGVQKYIDITELILFYMDNLRIESAIGLYPLLAPIYGAFQKKELLDRNSIFTPIRHSYTFVNFTLIGATRIYNGLSLYSVTEPSLEHIKKYSGFRFLPETYFTKNVNIDKNGGILSERSGLYCVKDKAVFVVSKSFPGIQPNVTRYPNGVGYINHILSSQAEKNCRWHVQIHINKNFIFEIPTTPPAIKELFLNRDSLGRKAPLLHPIRAHMRKMAHGVDDYVPIKRSLRGQYDFKYYGYPCRVIPSANDMHEQLVNNRSSPKVQDLLSTIEDLPENTDLLNS